MLALLLACAACHPAIAETQAATAHARALSRAEDGRWAFGSGAQAITYVSQSDDDTYLEHGFTWYRRTKSLALTPGHTGPEGVVYRTFAPDAAILRCFSCHSTGKLRLVNSRAIEPAKPGVHCESCHGLVTDHKDIRNPAKLSATEINDLCGSCHRMPPAKGVATNFKNPWNVRHQPVYLSQSPCFLKSNGKLSCLTCHNPHEDTKPRSVCKDCHAKPKHTVNISNRSCETCHMPKVSPSPNLTFTNHWIAIHPVSRSTSP